MLILDLLRGFGCRYSQWHLESLKKEYPKFKDLNTEVVIVGQHSRAEFANIWKMYSFPFVGLPDERERVARSYNQKIVFEKLGRLPAIFIVDLFGVVAYSHYSSDILDFPLNEKLLQVLKNHNTTSAPAQGQQVSSFESPSGP
jgi:peroxiredoxin